MKISASRGVPCSLGSVSEICKGMDVGADHGFISYLYSGFMVLAGGVIGKIKRQKSEATEILEKTTSFAVL